VNLLLADDVGLGKTIEAGLVAQELLLRHRARRIMIVCPAGLRLIASYVPGFVITLPPTAKLPCSWITSGAGDAVFQLNTDSGEVWLSRDGERWRPPTTPVPPAR